MAPDVEAGTDGEGLELAACDPGALRADWVRRGHCPGSQGQRRGPDGRCSVEPHVPSLVHARWHARGVWAGGGTDRFTRSDGGWYMNRIAAPPREAYRPDERERAMKGKRTLLAAVGTPAP